MRTKKQTKNPSMALPLGKQGAHPSGGNLHKVEKSDIGINYYIIEFYGPHNRDNLNNGSVNSQNISTTIQGKMVL